MKSLMVSTRADWDCPPATVERLPHPKGWAVHWPGVKYARFQTHDQCLRKVWQWDAQHRARGSRMLEYGGLVCMHGYYIEGRGTWDRLVVRPGSNGSAWANERYASVQFMVGTHDSPPIQREYDWLHEVIERGRAQDHRLRDVRGHRDFYNTTCPGDAIYSHIDAISTGPDLPLPPAPPPPQTSEGDTMRVLYQPNGEGRVLRFLLSGGVLLPIGVDASRTYSGPSIKFEDTAEWERFRRETRTGHPLPDVPWPDELPADTQE